MNHQAAFARRPACLQLWTRKTWPRNKDQLASSQPGDQKDADSLPPYAEPGAILDMLVDQDFSVAEIVAKGHERATVKRIEASGLYFRVQTLPVRPRPAHYAPSLLAGPPLSHRQPLAGSGLTAVVRARRAMRAYCGTMIGCPASPNWNTINLARSLVLRLAPVMLTFGNS